MVLRNIAGNLNPTAFRQGARDELELQGLQRQEQDVWQGRDGTAPGSK